MSVPQKFRAIGDFHEYYSGARKAPYTTVFVGGNHEASSHLQELYYGGWVAPNIYYLGAANVVRFGGLRIAGMSGIWKGYNYNKPHFERLPYSEDEIKSLYHVREIDIRKLLLLRTPVDVGVSHDWPRGIEWQGDWKTLFRKKDLFEADARAGTLGSSAARYVLDRLRPSYWFSAHLHCKFAAMVEHDKAAAPLIPEAPPVNAAENRDSDDVGDSEMGMVLNNDQRIQPTKNADEIDLDLDDEEDLANPPTANVLPRTAAVNSEQPQSSGISSDLRSQLPASFNRIQSPPPQNQSAPPPPPEITNKQTQFLALDKCLPNRKFLQILDVDPLTASTTHSSPTLTYDKEWLAILRVFASYDPHQPNPPNLGEAAYTPLISREEEWVEENLVTRDKMGIPNNFAITAPVYDGKAIGCVGREQPKEYSNPQTTTFCEMLGIPNWFDRSEADREEMRRAKTLKNQSERMNGSSDRGRGGGRRGRGGGRGGHGGGRGQGRGRGFR